MALNDHVCVDMAAMLESVGAVSMALVTWLQLHQQMPPLCSIRHSDADNTLFDVRRLDHQSM